jgi:predicted nuclease of predicted toxin-antitoxin system
MLLIDANLSFRILKKIASFYPDALHVSRIPLPHPSIDPVIWQWAGNNGCTLIVSQDTDFKDLVQQYGPPPKVIYLRVGNTSTEAVSQFLIEKHNEIIAFIDDPEEDLMEVVSF